jgi:hypothetical protein
MLGTGPVGLIVDMVRDVMRIPEENLTDSPAVSGGSGKAIPAGSQRRRKDQADSGLKRRLRHGCRMTRDPAGPAGPRHPEAHMGTVEPQGQRAPAAYGCLFSLRLAGGLVFLRRGKAPMDATQGKGRAGEPPGGAPRACGKPPQKNRNNGRSVPALPERFSRLSVCVRKGYP